MKKYWLPIVLCLVIIRLAKTQSDPSQHWIASTDLSIGLELGNDQEHISVSTDEANKRLSVVLPAGMEMQKGLRVQILDVYGVVLKDQRLSETASFVELQDLPLGVYAVRIQSPKMLMEHKLNIRKR